MTVAEVSLDQPQPMPRTRSTAARTPDEPLTQSTRILVRGSTRGRSPTALGSRRGCCTEGSAKLWNLTGGRRIAIPTRSARHSRPTCGPSSPALSTGFPSQSTPGSLSGLRSSLRPKRSGGCPYANAARRRKGFSSSAEGRVYGSVVAALQVRPPTPCSRAASLPRSRRPRCSGTRNAPSPTDRCVGEIETALNAEALPVQYLSVVPQPDLVRLSCRVVWVGVVKTRVLEQLERVDRRVQVLSIDDANAVEQPKVLRRADPRRVVAPVVRDPGMLDAYATSGPPATPTGRARRRTPCSVRR